ncbi:hypothetical protein FGIG_01477 [Fasciola gigantica]|uniref:Uncharacterized protein n=1 Tax=Fasciola gigantica TaxID=46835 RepID=A0A504YPM7_FASGI|nr:hypothetical protein FGIG_01477 [Fasciola gigantica]
MERIFGVSAKSRLAKVGSVIYMEVMGPTQLVGNICDEFVLKMHSTHANPDAKTFVRVISDSATASKQMEQLDSRHSMHMNAF